MRGADLADVGAATMRFHGKREPRCALIGAPCPRTGNPDAATFCPLWSDGITWTNTRTGQETVEHCGARMLVPGLIETIKASNRPAAATEQLRNGVGLLATMMRRDRAAAALPDREGER